MKYNTVHIQRDHSGEWTVSVTSDDKERVETETVPIPGLGFFHFPEGMSVEKAFEHLKNVMIEGQADYIERLQNDLKILRTLELPEGVKLSPKFKHK